MGGEFVRVQLHHAIHHLQPGSEVAQHQAVETQPGLQCLAQRAAGQHGAAGLGKTAHGQRMAAQAPQLVAADAAQHPLQQQTRDAQVDEVSDLEPIPGGVRLYLPYGRLLRQNLVWLGMGGALLGFGVMAGRMGAPTLFPVVFGGVGGAMVVWGFYALCNSLRVQLDQDGLQTERRLLGLRLAWHRVPARDIARLAVKESYSTQTGTRHMSFFRVQVDLKNGKKIAIADSLRGREAADKLLESIASATGYRR